MERKAVFTEIRILMQAEEIACKAGVNCKLMPVVGPPSSPCGMSLIFPKEEEDYLQRLWKEKSIEAILSDK
ncbi:MAG: putative Se/S carrier-like protein [Bacteroidales bacterium]